MQIKKMHEKKIASESKSNPLKHSGAKLTPLENVKIKSQFYPKKTVLS